jgi:hypothetical protein
VRNRRAVDQAAAVACRQTEAEHKGEDNRESGHRHCFAGALTRSVFGRYYWDDRLEAELRWQLKA